MILALLMQMLPTVENSLAEAAAGDGFQDGTGVSVINDANTGGFEGSVTEMVYKNEKSSYTITAGVSTSLSADGPSPFILEQHHTNQELFYLNLQTAPNVPGQEWLARESREKVIIAQDRMNQLIMSKVDPVTLELGQWSTAEDPYFSVNSISTDNQIYYKERLEVLNDRNKDRNKLVISYLDNPFNKSSTWKSAEIDIPNIVFSDCEGCHVGKARLLYGMIWDGKQGIAGSVHLTMEKIINHTVEVVGGRSLVMYANGSHNYRMKPGWLVADSGFPGSFLVTGSGQIVSMDFEGNVLATTTESSKCDRQNTVKANNRVLMMCNGGDLFETTDGANLRLIGKFPEDADVAYGNNTYVVVGPDGRIWTAPLAVSGWKWIEHSSAFKFYKITFAKGYFFASVGWEGGQGNIYSTDGLNWSLGGLGGRSFELSPESSKANHLYALGRSSLWIGYPRLDMQSALPESGTILKTDRPVPTFEVNFPVPIRGGSSFSGIGLTNTTDGTTLPVEVTISGTKVQVKVLPEQGSEAPVLDKSKRYSLVLPEGAIKGLNAGGMAASLSARIELNYDTEKGPLDIVASNPANGQQNVDLDTMPNITLTFNESIFASDNYDQITLKDDAGKPADFTPTIQNSKELVLTGLNLKSLTNYTITIPAGALQDEFGVKNTKAFTRSFATEDNVPPNVESTDPSTGSREASRTDPIRVVFSEIVLPGAYFDDLDMRIKGTDETVGWQSKVWTVQSAQGVDKSVLTLTPKSDLGFLLEYELNIPAGFAIDKAGNHSAEAKVTFTTESPSNPPVLAASIPNNGQTGVDVNGSIMLLWNKSIALAPGRESDIRLINSAGTSIDASVSIEEKRLIVTPNQKPLALGTVYTLAIPARTVLDQGGTPSVEQLQISFTTEKQAYVSAYPSPNSTGVPLNAAIQLQLESEGAAGFHLQEVRLTDGQGQKAQVMLQLTGSKLYLLPEAPLQANETYQVTLPRGAVVLGSSGQPSNAYSYTFSTGTNARPSLPLLVNDGKPVYEKKPFTLSAGDNRTEYVSFQWFSKNGHIGAGPQVTHTMNAGIEPIALVMHDAEGSMVTVTNSVTVRNVLDPAAAQLFVSPAGSIQVSSGETKSFQLSLTVDDQPLAEQPIEVWRSYPVEANHPDEKLVTVHTDETGQAVYTAKFPEDADDFHLLFTHRNNKVRVILNNQLQQVELFGYVLNDRNKRVSHAEVRIRGEVAYTDAAGYYTLKGVRPGRQSVKVSAENHFDAEQWVVLNQKRQQMDVRLDKFIPTDIPIVRDIYTNYSAPRAEKYFLKGVDAPIAFLTSVDWRGHTPGFVQFVSNGSYLNEADGRLDFNAALLTNEGVYATAVTEEGSRSLQVNGKVIIIEKLPEEFASVKPTFSDGVYKMERTYGIAGSQTPNIENIPIVKDSPLAFLGAHVQLNAEMKIDGTFTGYIGGKSMLFQKGNVLDTYLNKFKLNHFRYKTTSSKPAFLREGVTKMGSLSFGGGVNATYYWSYDKAKSNWSYEGGLLHVLVDARAYGEASYPLVPSVLSAYVTGEFEVDVDTMLQIAASVDGARIESGNVDLELRAEITGGVSFLVAKGGVYLRGTGKFLFPFPSGATHYYIELEGGARVSCLFWSEEWPFLNYSWGDKSYWDHKGLSVKATDVSAMSVVQAMAATHPAELELTDRLYLSKRSAWMPAVDGTPSSDRMGIVPLRTGLFPDFDHTVISLGDNGMMFITDDDGLRSGMNRTVLKASRYDAALNVWEDPQPLDLPDDGTADFHPSASTLTDGAVVAWQNTKTPLSADADITEALSKQEIAVATYDVQNGQWSGFQNLTNDDQLDDQPVVSASGNEAMLVWIKSTSPDYGAALGDSPMDSQNFMFSRYSGNEWSSAETAVQSLPGLIVSSSLVFDGRKAHLVYSVDLDKNAATAQDQELYYVAFDGTKWGTPKRLTDNQTADREPVMSMVNGKAMLVWLSGEKLSYTKDVSNMSETGIGVIENQSIQQDLSLVTKSDTLFVVGQGATQNGMNLLALAYDVQSGQWGHEISLTDDGSVKENLMSLLTGNRLLTVYKKSLPGEKSGPAADTGLYHSSRALVHDLEVSGDAMMLTSENPIPGETVTVRAGVLNAGDFTERGVKIQFYEGDPVKGGKKIGEPVIVDGPISPGGVGIAETPWKVPSEKSADPMIYVIADPEGDLAEAQLENNKASFQVFYADLDNEKLSYASLGDGVYALNTTIRNSGLRDLDSVNVSYFLKHEDGDTTKLGVSAVESLKIGETADISLNWTPLPGEMKTGGSEIVSLVEPADASVTEWYGDNNMRNIMVKQPLLWLESFTPGINQQHVSKDTVISLNFSEDILALAKLQDTSLTDASGDRAPIKSLVEGNTLEIKPTTELKAGEQYTLSLPAEAIQSDSGAVWSENWTMRFTVAGTDSVPLINELSGVRPDQTVAIPYSSAVSAGTKYANITVKEKIRGAAAAATLSTEGNVLKLMPDPSWKPAVEYEVFVPADALKGEAGQVVGAAAFTFITSDLTLEPKRNTSLTLEASKRQVQAGESVHWSAALTIEGAYTAPASGVVTFKSSTRTLETVPVHTDGTVGWDASGWAPGTYTVRAEYSGDSVHASSVSPEVTITVLPQPSSENPNPVPNPGPVVEPFVRYTDLPNGAREAEYRYTDKGIRSKAVGGDIVIDLDKDAVRQTVFMPLRTLQELTGEIRRLVVRSGDVTLEIPLTGLNLETLSKSFEDQGASAEIRLIIARVAGKEARTELERQGSPEGVFRHSDRLYEFELQAQAGGKTVPIKSFGGQKVNGKIKWTEELEKAVGKEGAGVYRFSPETQSWSWIPSRLDNERSVMVFKTDTFSRFAIMSYSLTFADIAGHWGKPEIEALASRHMVMGTGAQRFEPDRTVSRAEFVAMMVRAFGSATRLTVDDTFQDVSDQDWFSGAVSTAVSLGLIEGFGDGTFRPQASITRQQMAVILVRALSTAGGQSLASHDEVLRELEPFIDRKDVHAWAQQDVALAVQAGLLQGKSENRLSPTEEATRAEVAAVLERWFNQVSF